MPQLLYSPELAPSELLSQFGPLKDALRDHDFKTDDEFRCADREGLQKTDSSIFRV